MPKLYRLFIPAQSNQGEAFSQETNDKFLEEVAKIAGGYTIQPNVVIGGYLNSEGKLINENMNQLEIAGTPFQLQQVATLARQMFDQESIMAYEISPNVVFFDATGA